MRTNGTSMRALRNLLASLRGSDVPGPDDRRAGSDRRTGDDRRSALGAPPLPDERRSGSERRSGEDRRSS
jgi:hypothetical protein